LRSAGAGCAPSAISCSWRWLRSCPRPGWSASLAATCWTMRRWPPASMRCWSSANTSRSNAWARAVSRARRWRGWPRARSGARTRWWHASPARSGRSWTPVHWRWNRCWSRRTSIACPPWCGSGCVHISQLEGLRVALWGWGREGRAAYAALRAVAQRATVQRAVAQPAADDGQPGARFPAGLTLFCPPAEAAHARALGDPWLQIETDATGERLAAFDVVVKSPGISPYSAAAQAAVAQGTRFIGGTTLWFAGHADARSVSITGTK